jgi:hypothetical protein
METKPTSCTACGEESADLQETFVDGRRELLCRSCRDRLNDSCRCKEAIGKTPVELAKVALEDLKFWKKRRPGG